LHGEFYFPRERLLRHLIGRRAAVGGTVVRGEDGEHQLILRTIVSTDVREVELLTVAVPVHLSEWIASAGHADELPSVARLKHLTADVTTDLRRARWICKNSTIQEDERITIQGDARTAIQGDARTTIQGDARTTIQGDARTTIQGDARTTIQGNARTTLQVDARTTIQGDA